MNKLHLQITELWHSGDYTTAAALINDASWSSKNFAEFCAYFARYCGLKELNVLHKFL
jgi:hypothetical protein